MTHYLQFLTKAFQRLPMTALMTAPFRTTMKAAMLLFVAMMLVPLPISADRKSSPVWEDMESWYPLSEQRYDYGSGEPYITWRTILFDDEGKDEGFFLENEKALGDSRKLHVYISVGNDGEKYCGYLACAERCETENSGLFINNTLVKGVKATPSWTYGGQWSVSYGTYVHGTDEDEWARYIQVYWYPPFEYRNCDIKLTLKGKWGKWSSHDSKDVEDENVINSYTFKCPYTFLVRKIDWNGDYSVAPDGTVTIPYKFESTSRNTDGRTHLCTSINGKYNSSIGILELNGKYNNGSYSFNLGNIGKNLRSKFTIQPYHEFTHYKDRDKSGKTNFYTSCADVKTFLPLPKATIQKAEFRQADKQVVLTWKADNTNYGDGKWVIYRDGNMIKTLPQETTSFADTGFETESEVKYTIYYVMHNWADTVKLDLLKSDEKKVNTTREVTIREFNALSQPDRITLTWKADGLPEGWGHQFKIYVDKETDPIYTITPTDGQTDYCWEHRTTTNPDDDHTDRQNGMDGTTYYTEEPLNATNTHTYKVVSVIDDDIEADSQSSEAIGIGTGTTFIFLEASKNSYAGQVKLSWRVNRKGTDVSQTYTVYRRLAEKTTDQWVRLDGFDSKDEYLFYTDNTPLPRVCYEYRVLIEEKRPDGTLFTCDATDIGFSQASGTISGRVTFGTSGMAVKGVNVVVKKIGEENAEEQYNSVYLNSPNGKLTWNYPSSDYAKKLFAGTTSSWTIQMWINPDSIKEQLYLKVGHWLEFGMKANGDSKFCLGLNKWYSGAPKFSAGEYQHLTIAMSNDSIRFWLINSEGKVAHKSYSCPSSINCTPTSLTIGGFTGYVDEFRLWTRALTEAEILENYDHLLVGSEKDLEVYWPLDDGLKTQCFDYSRDGTVYRSHHGKMSVNTQSSPYTPDTLALRARTDSVGNYIIRGVPFSGEGTTYAVIPMLGVHAFNPTQQLRYVSANSLVHNGTDFDDVSSFPVSGTVLYAGTNYPVEGCNFYVDGQACSKDGELIETNAYGQFTISVPIGEHFIQVKKQGHEFVNNGRYPAQAGTYVNFDREVKNLTFYDSTLVNFTGRVAGGDIEEAKPVGFGQSVNNIGMATLTLTPRGIANTNYYINAILPKDGTVIAYLPNPNIDSVASASPDTIHSKAWRGYGNADECQKFYIRTDSLTGEFSAMLPPLDYLVTRIHVNSANLDLNENPIAVDMTNPQISYTDSLQNTDGTMRYYAYHSVLRQTYHSQPTFNVKQRGHKDGSFGIDEYELKDERGTLRLTDIHHINADTVEYTYGYPLFEMGDSYTFDLEGYEEYKNKDGVKEVIDRVPLSGIDVTIDNALSDGKIVYAADNPIGAEFGSIAELQSNQLRLDSLGKAVYTWYGGFPNITGSFTCDLNMYYDINGRTYQWREQPLRGIVIGDLLTGNNFVTTGPDQVDMILRDPPGSQSFATWEKGSISYFQHIDGNAYEGEESVGAHFYHGFEVTVGENAGFITFFNKQELIAEEEIGLQLKYDRWNAQTVRVTTTATKAISTSNLPEYDGAEGDLFIGRATNLIFGKSRHVGLYRDPADASKAVIDLKDALSVSSNFKTSFIYSQHYIVHDLLPNLTKMRNSTANKDSIQYFNSQIDLWKQYLAQNEEDKILAFDLRNIEDSVEYTNYSFDAGSTVSISKTTERSHGSHFEYTYKTGFYGEGEWGYMIDENGIAAHVQTMNIWGNKKVEDAESTDVATISYTLKDDDPDDAITVDVYDFKRELMTYKDWKATHEKDTTYKEYLKHVDEDTVLIMTTGPGHYASPIFRTRGGQTSNNYEGEVKTRYYRPGTTIMEATMQVEKPQIEAEPRTVSNVPSGSAANFALKLRNRSEVDADITYKLSLMESSNPNGAQLIIDGSPLTGDGRAVHIPFGEITKSLQLKQSDMSKLDYERIGIILSSQHQSSIADTVYITAHFVPSSSPVTLAVNTNIINTHTDTVLVLTMKDFDRHFYNLKAFRLQYKQQGGQWTDLHEYVLNGTQLSSNQQLLPDGASVVYRLSMKNSKAWTDGTYTFRIVSVSTYGTDEVYVYSNEETVIKDTSYPHPLGQAQPSDGVLDIGDEVSITYNIPFISGALTNENFLVTGVLNGAPVEHLTALRTYADDTQAAARTEANINLSGKDYSLDAWLNIRSAGTLFRHGSGKQTMEIRTDEAGHLMVAFFGDSVVYTSDSIVPRDKWVFFTLSRKVSNNKGKINVAVAEGSKDTRYLFTDKEVPLYNGNGPLSVGLGAEASVHEVLLWDEARDVETAVSQHSVTKSPSTRHLIGYWKMNEGEGKSIRDYARSRNMVMPAETWYINNVNKAVALDGTQHLAIYTAEVIPSMDDDYAVELWMQGGAQADTVQIFQLGEVSMYLDKNGKLHLQNNDDDQIINYNFEILNNTWHHILLNVRRIGTAAVYIDGQRALTVSATAIGDFASDSLIIGARRTYVPEKDTTAAHYRYDRYWTGSVDEVRLWKTTIASDLLASKRKIRLTGQEPGLSLYYPFEKKQLDEYNQIVTVGTLEEQSVNEKGNHNGTSAVIANSQVPIANYVDDAPALKEKPTQTNVAFAFTASDTKIVIDVKEAPANIDGCTLNFTVKDVRSVNGNNSLPATWSAFIHRNELAWQDDDLYITKEVDDTFSISTVLINRSGKPQRWSLGDLPTSLIVSSTSGMLEPLEKATITFRINSTAPLGKHERTIYAMGNNGIPTPLTLHITVTGDVPEWSVNPQEHESSMYMVAQLDFLGNVSDDEDDIVAAFINDTCRGVAHPEYKERYDGYYLTMTIYGNAGDQNKEVTFHAYDASSGLVYTLVNANPTVTYNNRNIIGRYDEPVLLSVTDQIEQRTTLKQGWNWISFYVKADNMKPETIFNDIADDVEAIKGHKDEAQGIDVGFMMPTDTGWVGSVGTLLNRRSYMVKMKNERELRIIGTTVNPATDTVRIHKNWGWPGYYGKRRITLANALAGADPQNGDIVRTQRAVAYFDDYEWVGSLQALEPGQGYAYYSVTNEEKWFAYPSSSVAAAPRRAFSNQPSAVSGADEDPTYTGRFAPDNEYGYPYNMILVGQVLLDNQPAANAEIGIFDGDECRSVGYTDAQGLLLMLVAGEDEAVLSYKMALGDQVYETVETLHYVTDAIVGTPDMPHLIRFGEGQGIEDVRSDDVRSTKVRKVFRNGVLYILRNGKTYTATGQEVR